MNNDWRSRNTMTGRDALRAASAILGLLIACILTAWLVTRALRPTQPQVPPTPSTEARP
jgi:hypothetical protein